MRKHSYPGLERFACYKKRKEIKRGGNETFFNAEREGLTDNTQTILFEKKNDITTMNKSNRRKLQFSIKELVD